MRSSLVYVCLAGLSLSLSSGVLDAQEVSGGKMTVRTDSPLPLSPQDKQPSIISRIKGNVTVILRDSTVKFAIQEVLRQVNLRLVYDANSSALSKRIKVNIVNTPASSALETILRGTGLVAKVGPDGETVMIRTSSDASDISESERIGTVSGRVTDSATSRGLAGVTVTVRGAKVAKTTNGNGEFTLTDVPAGEQTLEFKLVGYRAFSKTVRVKDGETMTANAVLRPAPTMLSEVVTTATGERRKVEVGHSIATINMDSLMRVAPIQSVTDALEGRVPGMMVQRTSGSPGDPARIRLRGTGSALENGDPIVIVDGVRVYGSQSDSRNSVQSPGASSSQNRSYATTSPLDQINPNSIEKIEVMKGPSASALYGSSAANGVIVITTKRGQVGPPQWDLTGSAGFTEPLNSWPTSTYQWVSPLYGGPPLLCIGFCGDAQVDSIIRFQALNDPYLTPLGRGTLSNLAATVSGGSGAMSYNLSANTQRESGVLKLPKIEEDRYLRFQNKPAPGWMRNPDLLERRSINGNIRVELSSKYKMNLGFIPRLTQETQRRTSMSSSTNSAIEELQRKWIDLSVLDERPILGNPYERVVNDKTTMSNTLSLNATPVWWFPIVSSLGIESITENGVRSLERGLIEGLESGGVWRGETRSAKTMSGRVNVNIPRMMRVRTDLGMSFDRLRTDDIAGAMFGIPEGIPDPNIGQDTLRNEFRRFATEEIQFGWHIQPSFILSDRFFLTPGFRLDRNGLSGKNAKFNGLPKMDFSWVVSDEPFFPSSLSGVMSMLRLRTAIGVSGTQPTQGDLYRLYSRRTLTDPQYGEILQLSNLGNTKLRPERVSELDWGADLELWQNRFVLEFTRAKKQRKDAIVGNSYAGSIEGGGSIRTNVGDFEDVSTEISVQAQVLERSSIALGFTANLTRRQSIVRRLNELDSVDVNVPQFTEVGTRYRVGYPLAGVWMRPIVGYADRDGNGWLSRSELVFGSREVFLGTEEAPVEMSVYPNMSLLKGLLNLSAGITHSSGQLQQVTANFSGDPLTQSSPALSNVVFGPVGFDRQAAFLGAVVGSTRVGFTQKVDVTRLQYVSLRMNLSSKTARLIRARNAEIALQASNLGLWTNYIGADPNVNGITTGHGQLDSGQLPEPRIWQLNLRIGY